MKTTTALIIFLSLGLYASAASVEFKIFKLNGEVPGDLELTRLCASDLLQPVYSGSAPINKDATFRLVHQAPLKYATDFSKAGVPTKFEEKQLGFIFSGKAVFQGGEYDLSYDFKSSVKDFDYIYLHKNGTAMPQPRITVLGVKSGVSSVFPDDWTAMTFPKDPKKKGSDYYAIALRITK